jgi:hypothetical protein
MMTTVLSVKGASGMKGVSFPLRPGEIESIFRFTIPAALEMERVIGCNPIALMSRGQIVYGICVMACYALKHDDKSMTIDKASQLVEAYIDAGGSAETLLGALIKALNRSGVYGPVPEEPEDTTRPTPTAAAAPGADAAPV